MKDLHYIIGAILLLFLPGCQNAGDKNGGNEGTEQSGKVALKTLEDSANYGIGMNIGKNLKDQGFKRIKKELLIRGIKDALADRSPALDQQTAIRSINEQIRTLGQKQGNEASQKGKAFLEKNKEKEGVKSTENGLQYKVLQKGSGSSPTIDDTVTVHYKGTKVNGEVFDSSYERGKPATFPLKGVIKGWQQGIPMMKTGGVWKFYVPSELAYGKRGKGRQIGPNETLIFKVELKGVK